MEFAVTAVLGGLSILLGIMAIRFSRELSGRTDQLVKEEDAIAKQLIKEMQEETRKSLERMDTRSAEHRQYTEKLIEDGWRQHRETMRQLGEVSKHGQQLLTEMKEDGKLAEQRFQQLLADMKEGDKLAEQRFQQLLADMKEDGKHSQEMISHAQEMLERMDKRSQETLARINESMERSSMESKQILERMDERTAREMELLATIAQTEKSKYPAAVREKGKKYRPK